MLNHIPKDELVAAIEARQDDIASKIGLMSSGSHAKDYLTQMTNPPSGLFQRLGINRSEMPTLAEFIADALHNDGARLDFNYLASLSASLQNSLAKHTEAETSNMDRFKRGTTIGGAVGGGLLGAIMPLIGSAAAGAGTAMWAYGDGFNKGVALGLETILEVVKEIDRVIELIGKDLEKELGMDAALLSDIGAAQAQMPDTLAKQGAGETTERTNMPETKR